MFTWTDIALVVGLLSLLVALLVLQRRYRRSGTVSPLSSFASIVTGLDEDVHVQVIAHKRSELCRRCGEASIHLVRETRTITFLYVIRFTTGTREVRRCNACGYSVA